MKKDSRLENRLNDENDEMMNSKALNHGLPPSISENSTNSTPRLEIEEEKKEKEFEPIIDDLKKWLKNDIFFLVNR